MEELEVLKRQLENYERVKNVLALYIDCYEQLIEHNIDIGSNSVGHTNNRECLEMLYSIQKGEY